MFLVVFFVLLIGCCVLWIKVLSCFSYLCPPHFRLLRGEKHTHNLVKIKHFFSDHQLFSQTFLVLASSRPFGILPLSAPDKKRLSQHTATVFFFSEWYNRGCSALCGFPKKRGLPFAQGHFEEKRSIGSPPGLCYLRSASLSFSGTSSPSQSNQGNELFPASENCV